MAQRLNTVRRKASQEPAVIYLRSASRRSLEGASPMSSIRHPTSSRRVHPGWVVSLLLGALVPLFIVFSAVTFVVAVGAYLLWLGFLALIVLATLVFDRFRRNRTGRPAKPAGIQRAIT